MGWIIEVFINSLVESMQSVFNIAMIIIPIMIFIEILRSLKILEKIYFLLEPLLKIFRLPKEAAMPIMAGLIFGISYGAGLIIQAAKEGHLTGRDLILINVFLALCHSLIEDTFLFVALGASFLILTLVRFFVAIIFTYLLAKYYEQLKTIPFKIKDKYNKSLQGEDNL